MAIQTRMVDYDHDGVSLQGELVWDDGLGQRPVVLVAPTWAGRTDFEGGQARRLAELGYVGFAIDMYGKGIVGNGPEECTALMMPIVSNRELLQARMAAALDAARRQPEASNSPGAAMGFCFGGLCVLDLARSGSDVAGVISFHGLLGPASNLPEPAISAKVLVLHGYDDPMADPDAMRGFCDEMTAAGCDWQVHAYGQTLHAFTNPNANDPASGTLYNEVVANRAYQSMAAFLSEVLN
ncbi:MAG: hypothetical protein RLZZ602_1835 [Pseudomonadota bacterium]|jgi:dienelactone hydrolase